MNKMLILLQQLHLENEVNELKRATIEKVVVNADNSYVFYIVASHIVPLEEIRVLFAAKNEFPYPCDFIFDWMSSYTDQDVKEYALFIFNGLKKRFPQIEFLNQDSLSFEENTLKMEVLNEIQLNQLQHLYKIFDKYFSKFGIQIGFDAYIDQNNETYQSIQEEMSALNEVQVDEKTFHQQVESPVVEKKAKFQSYKKEYFSLTIDEIDETVKEVMIQGYVFNEDSKKVKTGKTIQSLYVTDYTNSIVVKRFENKGGNSLEEMKKVKKGGVWVRVKGNVEYDTYAKDTVIIAREVEVIPSPKVRQDNAPKKRVELHVHSKMSAMDGIGSMSEYIERAAYWGHQAIAVTDHGNVQSFPEAQMASIKNKIKMIYGVEMYMIDPEFSVVYNEKDVPLKDLTFVSFDLETTGLSVMDDDITEFGAVRYKNGQEIGRLQSLIKPNKRISQKITNLTHITNEDVKDAPTIDEFIPRILDFFKDDVIVAHNATSVSYTHLDTRLLSAIDMKEVAEPYIRRRAVRHLEKGRIVIFGAGTGSPFFTTDTTAALRAAEMNADVILMAKNGVDGVYSADPKIDPQAKKYDHITYLDVLNEDLHIMDQTAITLCKDNGIDLCVFNMQEDGNIARACDGESIGTIISKGGE